MKNYYGNGINLANTIDAIIITIIAIISIYCIYCIYCIYFMYQNQQYKNEYFSNTYKKSPCNDKLTDTEFLIHMIPHHIVAIDVSYMLQKTTSNTVMHDILRNLIWMQEYEVTMMNSVLQQSLPEIRLNTSNTKHIYTTINRNYIKSVASFIEPNKVGYVNAMCDPNFFNVEDHRTHIQNMAHPLDEIMYIQHMIPHHQVAVDMSKRLLKYTNNPFMMELCYRIIRNQEKEIVFLHDMLDNTSWLSSNNSKILHQH